VRRGGEEGRRSGGWFSWLAGWLAGTRNASKEDGTGRDGRRSERGGSAGVVPCALSSLALAPRRVRGLVAFTEVRSVSDT